MKKLIIPLLLFLMNTAILNAQYLYGFNFNIVFPDTSRNAFLENNRVSHITVRYNKTGPEMVTLFFRDSVTFPNVHNKDTLIRLRRREFFDLEFEGDQYRIRKKYGALPIPRVPAVCPAELQDVNIENQSTSLGLTAFIVRDSIRYHLDQHVNSARKSELYFSVPSMGYSPWYPGDLSDLAAGIMARYNAGEHTPGADSAVLLNALIHEDGTLKNVVLPEGAPTAFADFLKMEIKRQPGKWHPGILSSSGRAVHSYVKIYCCLNPDNKLLIKTSRRFFSFFYEYTLNGTYCSPL